MESTSTSSLSPSPTRLLKSCDCGCSCSVINRSLSGTYLPRSVKRKVDEFEEELEFRIPGFDIPTQTARVDIGNECVALRETVSRQQVMIQDLITELEEERNAAASSANEAMSMILRLQREKAEIQMEAKQFKRYMEEKTVHDQQEMVALEDLLYKREQAIQSLTCEVQAYKHRMMSYGLTEVEAEGEKTTMSRNNSFCENLAGQFEFPPYEIYPPLKCNSPSCVDADDTAAEKEKHEFEETPRSHDQLQDLEKSPRAIQPDGGTRYLIEKIMSPRRPRHLRNFSTDSSNSLLATARKTGSDIAANSPKYGSSFKKTELSHLEEKCNSVKGDNASEGEDDRIYTIDSIYQAGTSPYGSMDVKAYAAASEEFMMTPREAVNDPHVRDVEMQKLYARLHALEVDRESMRQTMISMDTEKAQLVLLKEIAQKLCKERSMPVRKQSVVGKSSFVPVFKLITSFVFWRRKAQRCRYRLGLSANNAGLLMLLDRSVNKGGHWRRCAWTTTGTRRA